MKAQICVEASPPPPSRIILGVPTQLYPVFVWFVSRIRAGEDPTVLLKVRSEVTLGPRGFNHLPLLELSLANNESMSSQKNTSLGVL